MMETMESSRTVLRGEAERDIGAVVGDHTAYASQCSIYSSWEDEPKSVQRARWQRGLSR